VRLRIPNIEITRHPAPNAAEDLADKKSSVTDPTETMTYSLTITTAARSTFLRITANFYYSVNCRFCTALWIANLWVRPGRTGSNSR
jgi:hypothetical protein